MNASIINFIKFFCTDCFFFDQLYPIEVIVMDKFVYMCFFQLNNVETEENGELWTKVSYFTIQVSFENCLKWR